MNKEYIFLSYASSAMMIAEKINDRLQSNGIRTWMVAKDIKAGQNFSSAITDAIESCSVFLVVLDERGLSSAEVSSEVAYAISKEKTIVPFSLISQEKWPESMRYMLSSGRVICNKEMVSSEEDIDQFADFVKEIMKPHSQGAIKSLAENRISRNGLTVEQKPKQQPKLVSKISVALSKDENILLDKPYEGEEKYIFISYAHKDNHQVFPIIKRIQGEGYAVWYDEGIDPGNEWDDAIAEHIQKAGVMLAFISGNYINSDNCKDELNFARDEGIPRILVYLENTELPAGMKMRLGRQQAIHFYGYNDKEAFYDKLFDASEVEKLPKIMLNSGLAEEALDDADVYMSFVAKDVKWANLFEEVLRNDKRKVVMATEKIRSDVKKLVSTLTNSSLTVFLLSKEALADLRVIKELSVAIEMKKPIIPVFVEDFELSTEFQYYLANVARINAYELKGKALKVLVDTVDGILAQ